MAKVQQARIITSIISNTVIKALSINSNGKAPNYTGIKRVVWSRRTLNHNSKQFKTVKRLHSKVFMIEIKTTFIMAAIPSPFNSKSRWGTRCPATSLGRLGHLPSTLNPRSASPSRPTTRTPLSQVTSTRRADAWFKGGTKLQFKMDSSYLRHSATV